ncbi:hypothetical protein DV738_g2851, partial [Chaetothyriales sp. CBS 135597]
MSASLPLRQPQPPQYVSIAPLLRALSSPPPHSEHHPAYTISSSDIALAFSRTFENLLSPTQLAALLTLLHSTGRDRHPDVIAKCAASMRDAAIQVDAKVLAPVLGKRKRLLAKGGYQGGLCDIVGTGGDMHATFNISTTSSIIASGLLAMAKHGNRAQTSMSGSADVLNAIQPKAPNLEALTADNLPQMYERGNYAFLYAPNFHPGMRYAATVRRELGLRTIFNLMGPLANPVDDLIEVRVIGVAYQELGAVFAKALQLSGKSKALVVCGQEDLDEISCAGPTNCWFVRKPSAKTGSAEHEDTDESDYYSSNEAEPPAEAEIETFTITPEDFGLPRHPLSQVGGGKLPKENATVLMKLVSGEIEPDHPILHFVLLNVAALLVVSGVCDTDECESGPVIKERGPGGGRWKEGVKKARWCIESGRALAELQKFIDFTTTSK